MSQAFEIRPEVFGITGEEDHGLRSVLLFDFIEFSGNGVQGFIPGYRLEFPRTPGAGSFQRRLQTVFAVYVLAVCRSFGTERAHAVRVILASLHFDNFPVFHVQDPARTGSGIADGADGFSDLDACFRARNFSSQ